MLVITLYLSVSVYRVEPTPARLRGVPIIGIANISAANMLIFTVLVIGTDNQRSQYKCQYSACKINL